MYPDFNVRTRHKQRPARRAREITSALLASLGLTATAGAATLLDSIQTPFSLVAIGHDSASGNLYLYAPFDSSISIMDTNGTVLNTIPSPGAASNSYDLDFSRSSMNVGGTTIPANSLLVFNGNDAPQTLYALDKTDGSLLASVGLDSIALVGGAHMVGQNSVATVQFFGDNTINAHNTGTGLTFSSVPPGPPPFAINFGDLDIAESTGNLFLVSSSQNVIRELTPNGLCVRDIDVNFLGITNMSGVAVDDNTGFLWIVNNLGVVYHLDPAPPVQPDFDNDGITNDADNCIEAANPSQLDTDGDGFGNACDADIAPGQGDCVVNALDLGLLKAAFFSTPASANWNPHADFTGDLVVNVLDLGIMKQRFFQVPGPSGEANICGCGL